MKTGTTAAPALGRSSSVIERLNAEWHETGLRLFAAVVLAHWVEHLAQAVQLYVLGWRLPDSRGVLGQWFPWLVKSEALHYGYAIVMLAGIWVFRAGFQGRSYTWWMISFWIQFWHHIEHALLQGQALFHHNLFDKPVPTSIVQLWIPRVELHLFYNTVVFVPMAIGMYYHLFPPAGESMHGVKCNCAIRRPAAAASK